MSRTCFTRGPSGSVWTKNIEKGEEIDGMIRFMVGGALEKLGFFS